jgi:hypothetical protein
MISKLCFLQALFEEDNKRVNKLINTCSKSVLKLEEEFQQAITDNANWHMLPAELDKQLCKNKKQQAFIYEVIDSLKRMQAAVNQLEEAHAQHSGRAELGYEQELEKLKTWREEREEDLLYEILCLKLQLKTMDAAYAEVRDREEHYFNLYVQLKHNHNL